MPPVRLPRTNRVVKRLAGGAAAIYWFRRRGETPAMIVFKGETLAEALEAERAGADAIVAAYHSKTAPKDPTTVRDLVGRYKAAPDGFLKLREDSTRKTWSPWLDRIVDEFGDVPVAFVKAKGFRRDIIAWRNRWAVEVRDARGEVVKPAQPRSADYAIQVIRRLFAWGVENELVEANPAADIKGVYTANRADIIVEPDELARVLAKATPAGQLIIRLAAYTGMRRGDLIDLSWNEVGDLHIERAANKSTTGRRLLVPLIPEARAVIAEARELNRARKIPSTYVLTSSKGPWTKGGMDKTWNRAARRAGIDKHFNDLRGTACTNFYLNIPGLTDEEAADIMAWEPENCRAIRKRYVDPARIAAGIVARLERGQEGKSS